MMFAAVSFPDPLRFQAYPGVYALVAGLVGGYLVLARVVRPRAAALGAPPLTGRQWAAFAGAILTILVAGASPLRGLADDYLAAAHALQLVLLSLVLPPLVWRATPEWAVRGLLHTARRQRIATLLVRPLPVALLFNLVLVLVQLPGVVDEAVANSAVRFGCCTVVVGVSLLMWLPVAGPVRAWRMGDGARMATLFLTSVLFSLPSVWLTIADGVVYERYGAQPVRVWSLTPIQDQQLAGVVMKVGSLFLWMVVVGLFLRRFAREAALGRANRQMPAAEITGHDEVSLTFDDVQRAFERSQAPRESAR
ncbi:MAG: cytochrome c oxidase assembly protein [Acidimicrobiaceae bacterium]|nr:cytochrome c oxidase assembly protein [Ilumatobacter sp.]MCB9380715.1 cytochrome c oxidase assembly protein [Acidimicrobiaceae bacterium]MCO5329218.1 cytochrome c oxidase assembly protein [Ilumatobacteraceae bacterium]